MRGCNNSKIHISSNFILSICLLIMFITLQHLATLNHTTPNYTSLHLSTLHFLSFTVHYSPIWLNPSTFPIVLFHLTSLNQTQYGSHIPHAMLICPHSANRPTTCTLLIWFYQLPCQVWCPPRESRHVCVHCQKCHVFTTWKTVGHSFGVWN